MNITHEWNNSVLRIKFMCYLLNFLGWESNRLQKCVIYEQRKRLLAGVSTLAEPNFLTSWEMRRKDFHCDVYVTDHFFFHCCFLGESARLLFSLFTRLFEHWGVPLVPDTKVSWLRNKFDFIIWFGLAVGLLFCFQLDLWYCIIYG